MLHGDIKVNDHVIGTWTATRQNRDVRDYNEYYVTVNYTNQRGYKTRAAFYMDHKYGAGALALAAKVMLECGDRLYVVMPDHQQ